MLLKNAYMDFEKIEYSQKIWLKDTGRGTFCNYGTSFIFIEILYCFGVI